MRVRPLFSQKKRVDHASLCTPAIRLRMVFSMMAQRSKLPQRLTQSRRSDVERRSHKMYVCLVSSISLSCRYSLLAGSKRLHCGSEAGALEAMTVERKLREAGSDRTCRICSVEICTWSTARYRYFAPLSILSSSLHPLLLSPLSLLSL